MQISDVDIIIEGWPSVRAPSAASHLGCQHPVLGTARILSQRPPQRSR